MATVSKQWIIACWIIYVGYWIVSARGTKAAAERQSWPAMLAYRSPLLAGGTLLWLTTVPHPLSLALTPHTDLARAVAVVVCALGLSIAIWSRRTLGGNWSSEVTFKQGHELITAGPYRFARHPIYTGILLLCLGTAIASGQLGSWLGFLLLCAGFWIKLKQEESLLLRHFPEEYPVYRRRVKARVPFLV